MKEVTYEDWKKNPIQRLMWVWDDVEGKVKGEVAVILRGGYNFPVITVAKDGYVCSYKHCAEIEKQRRMTNKELSRWLRKKSTRECKTLNDTGDSFVYSIHTYLERCANEEVDNHMLIREDDGEWREPLVDVEE